MHQLKVSLQGYGSLIKIRHGMFSIVLKMPMYPTPAIFRPIGSNNNDMLFDIRKPLTFGKRFFFEWTYEPHWPTR